MTPIRLFLTAAVSLIVGIAQQCSPDDLLLFVANDPFEPEVVDVARIEAGHEVYLSQYCGICHQLDAISTTGNFGPAHNDMAALALERMAGDDYTGTASTVEEYILESIVDPERYMVPGYGSSQHRMPSYAHLSDEELALLVYMLANE